MAESGVCGPAQGQARRSWRGEASRRSLEMKCELAQLRCDAAVSTISALTPSIAATSRRPYRSFAFFGDHLLHLGEDFIGG